MLLEDVRRTIPLSLSLFAFTAVWVWLQSIAALGIFMLFLLAPWWSILLINAGFLGVGAEAAMGRVSRLWLALPIAWFGGYLLFAMADHRAVEALGADIAAGNAATHIPFDPATQALVVDSKYSEASLIDNYALPVLYSEQGTSAGFSHVSYRMIDKAACDAVRENFGAAVAGIDVTGFFDRTGEGITDSRFENRFCNLRQPEEPALPVVRVERRETKTRFHLMPVTLSITTIATPDGRSFTIRNGVAWPLTWLPMPVIGCNPFHATDCDASFQRQSSVRLTPERFRYSDDTSLPRALGLKPVQPRDRRAADAGATMQMVRAGQLTVTKQEIASLDAVLADGSIRPDPERYASLSGRTDLLLARVPAMVGFVEHAADANAGHESNAQQVFLLLKSLPPNALAPYRKRLEAAGLKDGWFK